MTIRPAGPVRVAVCGMATALLAMGICSAAAAAATSAGPFTVTTSAMQVTGFSYVGIITIPSGTGPVAVLEFAMSTASLTALDVIAPCTGASTVETLVGPAVSAQAGSGMTLDVTSLQATINGVAVAYTLSNPPASQPLPTGSGTLSSVTMIAMVVTAPSLTLGPMTIRTIACPLPATRPAAPAKLAPTAAPRPAPTPTKSPTVTPSPMPTSSPTPTPSPAATPNPSPTPRPGVHPSVSPMPTLTPTPTPSPTATPSPTPTPSPT